eukprot:366395-Chlamydomonas_euryale.AAC.8
MRLLQTGRTGHCQRVAALAATIAASGVRVAEAAFSGLRSLSDEGSGSDVGADLGGDESVASTGGGSAGANEPARRAWDTWGSVW